MLTLNELENMHSHTIFAKGTRTVEDYWDADKEMEIDFVAVRGEIPDWTIYYALKDTASLDWILNWGDKMRNERSIKKCVPCDNDAFKMYRF
jgi:hypothetical protein